MTVLSFAQRMLPEAQRALTLHEEAGGDRTSVVLALDYADPFAKMVMEAIARKRRQTIPTDTDASIAVVPLQFAVALVRHTCEVTSGALRQMEDPCPRGFFYLVAVAQDGVVAVMMPRQGAGRGRLMS